MPAGQRWKTSTPDDDNLLKAVMDGLNRVAYHDDAQVVFGTAVKIYGAQDEAPKTMVTLWQMPPLPLLSIANEIARGEHKA